MSDPTATPSTTTDDTAAPLPSGPGPIRTGDSPAGPGPTGPGTPLAGDLSEGAGPTSGAISARPEGSDATTSGTPGESSGAETSPANVDEGSGDPAAATDQSPPADLADTAVQAQPGTTTAEGTILAGQVPDGQLVTGFNTADGAPTIVDPGYVTPHPDQSTAQARANAAALAADEDATEAERSSGERTVTAVQDGPDVLDGAMISTNTGIRYRAKNTIRAVLLDRPFRADGRDGGDGDYLAEDEEGHRFVLTRDELDDAWVALA